MRSDRLWIPLLALDAALVLVFAVLGRAQHEHGLSPAGIASTAAPFLAALVLASAATRIRSTHSRLFPAGVLVWVGTVGLGLLLRVAFGATAAVPFIIVASASLAVLLLGRRLLSAALLRRRNVPAGRA
ncbi:DUF3054 domain-containing protein [Zafaria sp. Z1313]|uniref:DUF3054 domain-containing protein n=1 Tax=unclassified Zafaria TaxID=2828765 RepID=UPI002E79AA79|nr:DUF3054 domain-containing protein [Zafaria sp. J156]MEE1621182.1 DUF3054 domain-containing protein [Zafaria sp. J156]